MRADGRFVCTKTPRTRDTVNVESFMYAGRIYVRDRITIIRCSTVHREDVPTEQI